MQTEMLIHIKTSKCGRIEVSTTAVDVRMRTQRLDGTVWENYGDPLIAEPREAVVIGRALIQAAKFLEASDAD